MITFTPINNGQFWEGVEWSITDEDDLAILHV